MKISEIKDKILSFTNDVILIYNSEEIFINPWNDNKFELEYKDICKTYNSIDDLLSDKIYGGKSLSEIASLITE
ncbi:MAG: hypothetical protein IJN36_06590 [Clostridia bacterium]|nr:hypothetical protein [Clostridia bacterium]